MKNRKKTDKKQNRKITRRDFMCGTAAAAVAFSIAGIGKAAETSAAPVSPQPSEPAPQPKPGGADGIRLWQYVRGDTSEYFNYGLKIVPPWTDSGHLLLNFPEHLEYMPDTRGILRYSDKGAKGHWLVAADGTTAELDVESVTEPGVFVHGTARVVSKDRIDLTMKIINKTEQLTLGSIRPLYCFHYQHLKGFPQWLKNFEHTFFVKGGELVPVADLPCKNIESKVKTATVVGCLQKNDSSFAARRGGVIPDGVDVAISVVKSLDGKRCFILGWTPGKNVFTNANIPCLHADPYYGTIKPGESRQAKGVVILTEQPAEKVVKALMTEGVGAPGQS